ncbi:MAG: hypothetical protein EOO28_25100 [Comamonadaceae bacterium]|nr:MAG: hypothetical protein EOO28_25100 [Comamonadaceae bacterium]
MPGAFIRSNGLPGWLAGFGSVMLDWRARTVRRAGGHLEHVRQIMLGELDRVQGSRPFGAPPDPHFRRLRLRIGLCRDASGLWFLRSDLMQALSSSLGEYEARQRMECINVLFDGLLPPGLHSRPAPLR